MNLKKVFALSLAATAVAFAQQEALTELQAAPVADQPAVAAPAESPTDQAPAVAEQQSNEQPEVTAVAEPAPEPVPESAQAQETLPVHEPMPAPSPAPAPAPTPAPAPAEKAPEAVAEPAKPVVQESAPQVAVAEQPKPEVKAGPEPARMGPPPKTPFTVVHGNAYNMVENEAAADNVDLLLRNRLVKLAGQKFVYIEPAGEKGVVALGGFFGAMDLSGDLGRATLGYAARGFAADLRLSLGQIAIDEKDESKKGSYAGDDWGASLSAILGGYVVTASADWITFADEMNVTPDNGPKVEQRYRDLEGSLILSDGPVARKHFWSLGVAFVRHENENQVGDRVVNEDVDSRTTFVPVFNYGTPALRTERANLYLGLNTSFPITIFDQTESRNSTGKVVKTSQYNFGATIVPNIVSEVLFNKYVMFFGEANYEWNAIRYIWGKAASGKNYTIQQSVADKVNASIGTRLQYDDLVACEFTLGDSFFTDTKSIFNGEGVFIKFGGFIYF